MVVQWVWGRVLTMDTQKKNHAAFALPDEFASTHFPELDERILTCPNCGSDDCQSNHIDEAVFRRAARYATTLRELGRYAEASDLLARLASVKIINFLRKQWRCRFCEVHFDE